jgi:RNA polymerase sigma-70 factor, ECF subfamily
METRADPDAELMLRVGSGETFGFSILMNKHRSAVIRFIYRKVKNLALAEELSQEVFLRVYRSRESYRPTAKFRTWLFRIATNLALNAVRDSRPEGAPAPPLTQVVDWRPSVEDSLVHQVRFGQVRQAIAELPALQRSAVVMQRYRDMDYAAIARALGCSEPAVKSLLFRAHETLRHRLAS